MSFNGTQHGDDVDTGDVADIIVIALNAIMMSFGLNTHCDVTQCMNAL